MSASSKPLPWEVSSSHVKNYCEFCKRKHTDLEKHINTRHRDKACAKYPELCCKECRQYFSTVEAATDYTLHNHNIGRNPLYNLANAAAAVNNRKSRSRSRSPRRNHTKNNKGGYRRKTRYTKKYRTRRH